MRPRTVAVRCFAEQSTNGWEAHCVDLALTVRGDSLERVKRELDTMVHRVLDDQLLRTRKMHVGARPLLRKAIALRLRYWGLVVAGSLGLRRNVLRERVARQPGIPQRAHGGA